MENEKTPAAPVSAAAEEKLKTKLQDAFANPTLPSADKLATPLTQRRDDHATKDFTPAIPPDPQRETIASALASQANAKRGTTTFNFLSKFPNLTIYVNTGATEREPGGQLISRATPVKFFNGVFQTTSAKLAALIRLHPQCGSQLFRETESEELFHLRKAAAAREAATRAPTFSGATASSDGAELGLLNQQKAMLDIENRILQGEG